MHDDITLITTISVGLGLALILGFLAVRLRLPALVGYLVAGILIGPFTPGFVADMELSQQLAEIGVILLMFGVGLHFSFGDLMSVRRIAVLGAIAQIIAATVLGAAVAHSWGWSLGSSVVFGLSLSVASTVVLLRALESRNLLDSINGRIAVGWLVMEDLVMVLTLVVLPPFAGWLGGNGGDTTDQGFLPTVLSTLGKVTIFVVLMLVVGRRLFPWFLWRVAGTGSRELFTLCVVASAMGIAYTASTVFGVSFALGAFFAGSVLRESSLSHRAANESLPLRDAFAVLFFVSVGMLFDPAMLVEQPLRVLAVVAIVMLGKTLVSFGLVLLFRYPLGTALTVSVSLAQIGEFSFILAARGISLGLLTVEAQNLILAGALISIALNPLLFKAVEPLQQWLRSRSGLARAMERSADPMAALPVTVDTGKLAGHAVLVGYGRVGSRLGPSLLAQRVPIVVVEQNRDIVEQLRGRGIPAVAGDAAKPEVLNQAYVITARLMVIAIPNISRMRKMVKIARMLQPDTDILVCAQSDEDADLLRGEQVDAVFVGDTELALSLSRDVVERMSNREQMNGDSSRA